MFAPQRPDPAESRKELIGNVKLFAISIVVVRASTYILDLLQSSSMCGIFGIYSYHVEYNRSRVVESLLRGLQRLEYRGYDSAGIAVDSVPFVDGQGVSEGPIIVKAKGKVEDLKTLCEATFSRMDVDMDVCFKTQSAIAHTRWATHGPPSSINAHPQSSGEDNAFVVVHNGIITNFNVLKEFLIEKGEKFMSDTDTEVIAKLCSYVYRSLKGQVSLAELLMDVISRLNGSYALLVKSIYHPGQLVACKKGSPLILGLRGSEHTQRLSPRTSMIGLQSPTRNRLIGFQSQGSDVSNHGIECFLSSDAAALVEHTKDVLVLDDGDIVHINNGELCFFNVEIDRETGGMTPRRKNPELTRLDMEVEQIMKGGYDHFMEKEIFEQPETLLQTMKGRVLFDELPFSQPRVKLGGLMDHLDTIRRCGRIVIIACGTSYNAGLACRPALEKLVAMPVSMELASDLLDRQTPIFRDDACIFMSQSGETADTLCSLEFALKRGALCIGITNTVGSAIARLTHCGVHLNAGAEIGVASTKAYTSQIVVLLIMALALSGDRISSMEMRNMIIQGLESLSEAVRTALKLDSKISALASSLQNEHSLLIFGRGSNYATAVEGALKVKEVSLMHSEGILAGEMKHGPLALVDEHMPILVVATPDSLYSKMLSVIEQLKARGANLIVICSDNDDRIISAAGRDAVLLPVPSLQEYLQPVVNIIPLQLLAYHLAVKRGHNVDQPRNLAKSVTVSEES